MSYVDVLFGDVKSHEDWGLKLETIQLSFPEAKTDQIDIPGANGVIDLTEVNGQVCYKNRTMTLTFSLDDDYAKWHLLSSRIAKELHGKVINVLNDCCTIKCKNGCIRYANINDVIEFCDNKELCYMIK